MQPLILLSTGRQAGAHSMRRTISGLYGAAVTLAGGLPVSYAGSGSPGLLAERFDGLLLTGGEDAAPELYGARRLPTDEVDETRDAEEFALTEAFAAKKRPIFGICRGIQLLNVYFGGTLCQHIPDHADNARHPVETAGGSRVRALLGSGFAVNSWHHQAVRTAAPPFAVTAASPDGTVEALEHQTLPIFAVQWHPERLIPGLCTDLPADHLCLFTHFIKECRKTL